MLFAHSADPKRGIPAQDYAAHVDGVVNRAIGQLMRPLGMRRTTESFEKGRSSCRRVSRLGEVGRGESGGVVWKT